MNMQKKGLLGWDVFPDDIEGVFRKPSRHPIWEKGRHVRGEAMAPQGMRHAECSDCHNHHKVDRMLYMRGSGKKRATLSQLQYEYDVCYRCHGPYNAGLGGNIAALLNGANRSYHPVEAVSKGTGRGLKGSWAVDSVMACTDCHGNNDSLGPQGPHGSDFSPLLVNRYEQSNGFESSDRYGLCYTCHSRNTLLTNSLFPSHTRHLQQAGLSCASCHDAHGSPLNRALIDFGRGPDVRPAKGGRLEFQSAAPGSGTCYVNCHGVEHDGLRY